MEVIQAEIDYWQSLKDEQGPCKHESCGQLYPAQPEIKLRTGALSAYNLPNEHLQKCSKCGEFYK